MFFILSVFFVFCILFSFAYFCYYVSTRTYNQAVVKNMNRWWLPLKMIDELRIFIFLCIIIQVFLECVFVITPFSYPFDFSFLLKDSILELLKQPLLSIKVFLFAPLVPFFMFAKILPSIDYWLDNYGLFLVIFVFSLIIYSILLLRIRIVWLLWKQSSSCRERIRTLFFLWSTYLPEICLFGGMLNF